MATVLETKLDELIAEYALRVKTGAERVSKAVEETRQVVCGPDADVADWIANGGPRDVLEEHFKLTSNRTVLNVLTTLRDSARSVSP